MNKIKEIHNELFLEQHSYVNSDKRELFELYLYENIKRLNSVIPHIKQELVKLWYMGFIVRIMKDKVQFSEPLTEIQLNRVNEEIKSEFEKEGRCEITIRQLKINTIPTGKTYHYEISGSIGYNHMWRIRKK